jgi:hypothetical protein
MPQPWPAWSPDQVNEIERQQLVCERHPRCLRPNERQYAGCGHQPNPIVAALPDRLLRARRHRPRSHAAYQ